MKLSVLGFRDPIDISTLSLDRTTPIHAIAYSALRSALEEEVFSAGFHLPRCLAPEGAYSWVPASNFSSFNVTASGSLNDVPLFLSIPVLVLDGEESDVEKVVLWEGDVEYVAEDGGNDDTDSED